MRRRENSGWVDPRFREKPKRNPPSAPTTAGGSGAGGRGCPGPSPSTSSISRPGGQTCPARTTIPRPGTSGRGCGGAIPRVPSSGRCIPSRGGSQMSQTPSTVAAQAAAASAIAAASAAAASGPCLSRADVKKMFQPKRRKSKPDDENLYFRPGHVPPKLPQWALDPRNDPKKKEWYSVPRAYVLAGKEEEYYASRRPPTPPKKKQVQQVVLRPGQVNPAQTTVIQLEPEASEQACARTPPPEPQVCEAVRNLPSSMTYQVARPTNYINIDHEFSPPRERPPPIPNVTRAAPLVVPPTCSAPPPPRVPPPTRTVVAKRSPTNPNISFLQDSECEIDAHKKRIERIMAKIRINEEKTRREIKELEFKVRTGTYKPVDFGIDVSRLKHQLPQKARYDPKVGRFLIEGEGYNVDDIARNEGAFGGLECEAAPEGMMSMIDIDPYGPLPYELIDVPEDTQPAVVPAWEPGAVEYGPWAQDLFEQIQLPGPWDTRPVEFGAYANELFEAMGEHHSSCPHSPRSQ